jgi:TRAP-type C4-dicarboxylate transport system permease small subunit
MPSTAKADTAPSGVRRLLDAVYDGAGALAALLMIGLLAMVLLSIVSRQLHFHVRGTDAYAGYLMAGAGFLALAHTLKRGEHIRVTLLLGALQGSARRALEIWSLGLASVLATLFAFYSCRLVWQSLEFHDISTSNDATPLWIPQLTMALGTSLLALAFVDEWILEITGRRQTPAEAEMLRNE